MKKILIIILLIHTKTSTIFCQNSTKIDFSDDSIKKILQYDLYSYAQSSLNSNLSHCPYILDSVKRDIKNKSLKLAITTGFIGTQNLDEYLCKVFERNYNVKLEYVGCIRICNSENEDINGYNEEILNHLEMIYGKVVYQDFNNLMSKKENDFEEIIKGLYLKKPELNKGF